MKNRIKARTFLFIILLPLAFFQVVQADSARRFPTQGLPTMVDFGSITCIPCKLMIPVLESAKEKYKGKAEILFVDVKKDLSQAILYQIKIIPSQGFFDENGEEITRHVGFLSEKGIDQVMKGIMGISLD